MSVNHYLDHYQNRSEQNLVEDLTIEAIKFNGIDLFYIPRDLIKRDDILGESIESKFKDDYLIEMYVETVDGFEGNKDLLNTFGMSIKDTATFIVSKRRFNEVIPHLTRPFEGDLIYFPLSKGLFEINYVEHENPFYQLGKEYTYKLTVELFTYSNEEFELDNPEIDAIEDDYKMEDLINPADNTEIQNESDLIVVENPEAQKSDFLNTEDDDPFNGF